MTRETLEPITLEGNLDALRVFIRWCESIDAVPEGLHDKIMIPVLKKHDEQANGILGGDDAAELLSYLRASNTPPARHPRNPLADGDAPRGTAVTRH